jgi:hypothetical protein
LIWRLSQRRSQLTPSLRAFSRQQHHPDLQAVSC